jgi:hypothetical protein
MPLVESCLSLQNRIWQAPNEFNHCLDQECHLWEQIIRRGGLEMVCQTMRKKRYLKAPWVEMPPEGERLQKVGSIPLPAAELVDTPIVDFTMPIGWDGVGTNVMMTVAGSGFVEGSGDVVWRMKVGQRWIPDFSNVIFSLNDLRNPHALIGGYIRLLSLQRVQIFAMLGAGALGRLDPADRLNAAVVGWTYPKR